jgi:hypothetical protein
MSQVVEHQGSEYKPITAKKKKKKNQEQENILKDAVGIQTRNNECLVISLFKIT